MTIKLVRLKTWRKMILLLVTFLLVAADLDWMVESWTTTTTTSSSFSSTWNLRSHNTIGITQSRYNHHNHNQQCHSLLLLSSSSSSSSSLGSTTTTTATSSSSSSSVGPQHIDINDSFPNLNRIHSNPDVYVVSDFLSEHACQDLIRCATQKGDMTISPVAYAGWTRDFVDLMELAIKGPVTWAALIGAWYQVTHTTTTNNNNYNAQVDLVIHALQNFGILLVVAAAIISAFTFWRASSLQSMRTSTSTTLDNLQEGGGSMEFVKRASQLLQTSTTTNDNNDNNNNDSSSSSSRISSYFEAPTIIRYDKGQVLAPHYDANSSASVEDTNRGGQTLVTLLVYLNNVSQGGKTRFGKLNLEVSPKQGDALLFFPADKYGTPDDRLEHEGCPAVDEKWIARIWQHENRVPPPFGLQQKELNKLNNDTTTTTTQS